MKASELRIGSKISKNNNIITVDAKTIFDIWINDGLKIYDPIPLTEEWLLKFGFEKGSLIYFNLNGEIVFKGDNAFRYFGLTVQLKYVHQLQNLYFALTGQEL